MSNFLQNLFEELFNADTEQAIDIVFDSLLHGQALKNPANWYPLGGNESNYGVVENQQSSPIAALIEKITNSIDATLMRRCYEWNLNPKSDDAPRSMEEALEEFWPQSQEHSYYKFKTIREFQRRQSKEIQIIGDGPKRDTSLIIYDNGEGQYPENFEDTFLSLLRGNKNEIPFVQGRYNMGGTGAIVFCGKKRYQLIASKRYDGTGKFGYTLIRQHPLTEEEKKTKKNTWYEYFKIDGEIPAFDIDELDLGLDERNFKTGTVIKLYSYRLPAGHSTVNRDLNQSINEFLFEPALPISVIEKEERYPKDNQLSRYLYGLKRRLEDVKAKEKYIEDVFSEEHSHSKLGKIKVTTYLFKNRVDGKSVAETKKVIQAEFFKNNMAVMFSMNGQVHGHYTSEFITRRLKFPIFKDYLLIHVDCTNMKLEVRNELFMASRDRLKGSEETTELRDQLAKLLNDSELKELHKRRKEALSLSSGDTNDLLKSFTKSMPLNSDLMKLLNNTFELDLDDNKKSKKDSKKKKHNKPDDIPFDPQRYPSFFKHNKDAENGKPIVSVPLEGQRSIKFKTDVEDSYFDRTDTPGDLQIALLKHHTNEAAGGNNLGLPKDITELINVTKSSPNKGTIKLSMTPAEKANIGDSFEIKATLLSPDGDMDQLFLVKVVDKDKVKEKAPKKENDEPKIGLPKFQLLYKAKKDKEHLSWDEFESTASAVMDHSQILHPLVDGDKKLETMFINMESSVLLNHKKKLKTERQIKLADKKYISSVYFHALFLYTIAKKKKIEILQDNKEMETEEYIKEVFSTFYSEFLLNFGLEELMDTIST